MLEAGVASGINSAIRELGGVLGVAVLASVFSRQGGYTSRHSFLAGFTPAIWVAVGLSALGMIAAALARPPRSQSAATSAPIAVPA
jgi:hypothetical protein